MDKLRPDSGPKVELAPVARFVSGGPEAELRRCPARLIAATVVVVITVEFTRQWADPTLLRLAAIILALGFVSRRPFVHLLVILPVLAAFAPLDAGWIVGPAMYVPLFWWLRLASPASVCVVSIALGVGHAAILTPWLTRDAPSPALAEWLYCGVGATYFIAVLFPVRFLQRRGGWRAWPAVTVLIPLAEWTRSHIPEFPMPYHLTAHAVAGNLPFAQLAEPLGVLGLSGAICLLSLVGVELVDAILARQRFRRWSLTFIGLLLIFHVLGLGRMHAVADAHPPATSIRVAALRSLSGSLETGEIPGTALLELLTLELREGDAELIVFPEGAAIAPNGSPTEFKDFVNMDAIAAAMREAPAAGAVVSGLVIPLYVTDEGTVFRDSIARIDPSGSFEARDKRWFSPVNERAPFQRLPVLDALGRKLTASQATPVAIDGTGSLRITAGIDAAVCVCLDGMMPDVWSYRTLSRRPVLQLSIANLDDLRCSQVQWRQSAAARSLHAIVQRAPFVYVTTCGSEWVDVVGHVHHFERGERGVEYASVRLATDDAVQNGAALARDAVQCVGIVGALGSLVWILWQPYRRSGG